MAKLFVADDDQLALDLISFRLQRLGHDVSTANDGELALTEIQRLKPELIILDYVMPVISGREIVSTLKNNPETANIPIIILTGQWREKDVMEALDLGITDYMTKPFSPEELIFRVKRALASL
ncbi:MAG: response regulator [Pseudohongiellaceae bacterium]|nr:response regulator [Pseudohongiellaceae bacterium]